MNPITVVIFICILICFYSHFKAKRILQKLTSYNVNVTVYHDVIPSGFNPQPKFKEGYRVFYKGEIFNVSGGVYWPEKGWGYTIVNIATGLVKNDISEQELIG